MRVRTWVCWTVVSAAQTLAACDRTSAPDELAHAINTAHPFAAKFETYETWTLRATSVRLPSGGNAALAETLFAPIRNDPTVLAAWIKLPNRSADELSFPPKVAKPDPRGWTQVRAPLLGWIRVSRHAQCPVALPKGWRNGAVRCVIIARDRDHDPVDAPTIAMAFVDPDPVE